MSGHKRFIIVLTFCFAFLTFIPISVSLAQSNLTQGTPINAEQDLPTYIANIYKFGVGIVAILAVVVIMWGGLIWITAGGNTGQIDNAKQWISGAVLGLFIALTSYVILNTVNPQLTNLSITKPGCVSGIDPATGKCKETKDEPICCQDPKGNTITLRYSNVKTCESLGSQFKIADKKLCLEGKLQKEGIACSGDEGCKGICKSAGGGVDFLRCAGGICRKDIADAYNPKIQQQCENYLQLRN